MKLRQDDSYSVSASHSKKTLRSSAVDDYTCFKKQAKKPNKPHWKKKAFSHIQHLKNKCVVWWDACDYSFQVPNLPHEIEVS